MKLILWIVLISAIISCSQEKKTRTVFLDKNVEELLKATKTAKTDSLRTVYLKAAEEKIGTLKNDSVTRNARFKLALGYYQIKDYENFIAAAYKLKQNSVETNDTINLARITRYIGGYYKNVGAYDSSFVYYLKSEKLYRSLGSDLELGNILVNKSIVQFHASDYIGADRSATQAYSLLKNYENNHQKLYEIFTMMGIISNELKDYDKAIEYYDKALRIVKDNNLNSAQHEEATCLNNMGYAYQNLGRFQTAISHYIRALSDKDLKDEMPDLYSLLIDNLAYSKFKVGDYKGLPSLFYDALAVRKQINANTLTILSYIHLSEYYFSVKDSVRAVAYANDALKLAREKGTSRDLLAALKQASAIDALNSSRLSQDYIRINDSIQTIERKSQEKFTRLQLETDEISLEKDKLEEQNRTLFYFFITILSIGVLLFVIRTQRAKNRELLLKQAQQKANEDIYNLMITQQNRIEEGRIQEKKRIARELHDGVLGRLFGTRLNLDSLNRNLEDLAIEKRFAYLAELKNIEQDIREISHDLNRENYVLINNFLAILNNLFEEQRSSFKITLNVSISDEIEWDKMQNVIKINIYRIIQEALQNINKYAEASSVQVRITNLTNVLHLVISDNGIGFNAHTKKKGIGIQNMISRTHEMHGTFEVKSKKAKGTQIIVMIPFG